MASAAVVNEVGFDDAVVEGRERKSGGEGLYMHGCLLKRTERNTLSLLSTFPKFLLCCAA